MGLSSFTRVKRIVVASHDSLSFQRSQDSLDAQQNSDLAASKEIPHRAGRLLEQVRPTREVILLWAFQAGENSLCNATGQFEENQFPGAKRQQYSSHSSALHLNLKGWRTSEQGKGKSRCCVWAMGYKEKVMLFDLLSQQKWKYQCQQDHVPCSHQDRQSSMIQLWLPVFLLHTWLINLHSVLQTSSICFLPRCQ